MAEPKKPEKGGDAAPAASIIIKKVQGGHGGGHGGAWKIALADMMTAMMAFFLLMWLLGATSEAQRKSIADYFKPTPKSRIQMGQLAGSNGILGGRSILDPEGMPSSAFQNSLLDVASPQDTEGGKDRDKGPETDASPQSEKQGESKGGTGEGDKAGGKAEGDKTGGQNAQNQQASGQSGQGQGAAAGKGGAGQGAQGQSGQGQAGAGQGGNAQAGTNKGQGSQASNQTAGQAGAQGQNAQEQGAQGQGGTGQGGGAQGQGQGGGSGQGGSGKSDSQTFSDVQQELMIRLSEDKNLSALKEQVRFVQDKDGLRIEIIDKADFAMFSLGTNKLQPRAQALLEAVAKTVADLPNKVYVRGHTDGFGFASNDPKNNNWALSAERADSTRQLLEKMGVPSDRITRIEGVADKQPFNSSDPYDARNRRISITLQYKDGG
jgi:chemotaxis protein MotB